MAKKEHHIVQSLKDAEHKVSEGFQTRRKSTFERFPLLFTLLGSFGLVATFYGFERVIDQIDFLNRNPFILLGTGIFTLVFTGTLYDKLK